MSERSKELAKMEPKRAHGDARRANIDQKMEAIERELQALELRKAGKTFDFIAKQVGYQSRGAAWNAVNRALNRTIQEPSEELRIMEIERLNALLDALWKQATTAGAKGQTFAIDRVLNVMKRRAELLGLDAPQKKEVITKSMIDSEIEKLEGKLGAQKVAELKQRVRARQEAPSD